MSHRASLTAKERFSPARTYPLRYGQAKGAETSIVNKIAKDAKLLFYCLDGKGADFFPFLAQSSGRKMKVKNGTFMMVRIWRYDVVQAGHDVN